MIFTLDRIIKSLAGVLEAGYPEYPVYDSPTPQDTEYPCFYIFFMPSSIEGQIGERYMRDLGLDIVFVQQRNIVSGNMEIHTVADYLDEVLEQFPYSDGGGETVLIRTYDREWRTEDMELHYQFHIRQRVAVPADYNPMREMEGEIYVKEDGPNGEGAAGGEQPGCGDTDGGGQAGGEGAAGDGQDDR